MKKTTIIKISISLLLVLLSYQASKGQEWYHVKDTILVSRYKGKFVIKHKNHIDTLDTPPNFKIVKGNYEKNGIWDLAVILGKCTYSRKKSRKIRKKRRKKKRRSYLPRLKRVYLT